MSEPNIVDTPRVDGEEIHVWLDHSDGSLWNAEEGYFVKADFARQLESELSAATRESTQRPEALLAAQERVRELEAENARLTAELQAASLDARRLREALQYLYMYSGTGTMSVQKIRAYIENTLRIKAALSKEAGQQ